MKIDHSIKSLLEALHRLPGYPLSEAEPWFHNSNADSDSVITLPSGLTIDVGFKDSLTTAGVEQIILNTAGNPFLVFAPYVSPVFAERLCKHGVFFVDETGNAFLQWPGYHLFVSRELPKRQRPGNSGAETKKDFSANALKLIFAFLTDEAEGPEALVNQTVRYLNARTGLSTGSISGILDSLKVQGFIEEREPGIRRLLHREKLFERWVQEYGLKLRPKLSVEHYRLPKPGWAGELLKNEGPGLWGGEVAGACLTGYLVPETVTIYAEHLPADFIVKHDLRKDPAGRVEVLRPFWKGEPPQSLQGCAHPLIVYADLMASEIDRNLETAKRIYEQYLRPLATSN
jgi:hypothetical protein